MWLTILLLTLLATSASARTLKVKTTSSDTTKQCVQGVTTKTKTGETDLTMHLNFELGISFTTSNGKITIDLPMRYHDIFAANAATARDSMVDSSLLSVYMIYSGTTYRPSVELLESQSLVTSSSGEDT